MGKDGYLGNFIKKLFGYFGKNIMKLIKSININLDVSYTDLGTINIFKIEKNFRLFFLIK